MGGDFDAVSCAAYFGPSSIQEAGYSASTTETQVMNDTIASIPTALNFLSTHKRLARSLFGGAGPSDNAGRLRRRGQPDG